MLGKSIQDLLDEPLTTINTAVMSDSVARLAYGGGSPFALSRPRETEELVIARILDTYSQAVQMAVKKHEVGGMQSIGPTYTDDTLGKYARLQGYWEDKTAEQLGEYLAWERAIDRKGLRWLAATIFTVGFVIGAILF